MGYCIVGEGQGVFGIKGEIKVYSYTDFPDTRFKVGNTLFIQDNDKYIEVTIRSYRTHKKHVLLSFNEFPDINFIEKYAYNNLVIREEDKVKLPQGQYYPKELIGLKVYQNDILLGEVIDVDSISVHSILRVKNSEKEILIPYVKAYIENVDIKKSIIIINKNEGLL